MLRSPATTRKSTETNALGRSNPAFKTHAILLLIVWASSICYLGIYLKRGWVPHDEGTLGLSAERVLHGEMPHRDFDDYTGGLTFAHALAFRELGINSTSMRIVLLIFFIAWVPLIYYVASRFSSPYAAAAITLLAVAWSVPNYPAPMPSWYNLFFATAGTAALVRYVEKTARRWLFLAGLCGGISFLAKITAAYFVAAALLFFVFREQSTTADKKHELSARARSYGVFLSLAMGAFIVLLFRMIHKIPGIGELIYFVLPSLALVGLLLAREIDGIAGQNRERFLTLLRMCMPFGLGMAIPIILFLVPYVLTHSVGDLIDGLLAGPARATRFATWTPASPLMMISIIPFGLPIVVGCESQRFGRAVSAIFVASFAFAILIFSRTSSFIYSLGWWSLALATPVLTLVGVVIFLAPRERQNLSPVRQQQVMIIMCVAALCGLVQFPFTAPVYFFFVAPLAILFAAALLASAARPPHFALGALLVFYLLFAVLRVTPGFVYKMALHHPPNPKTQRLTIPRADGLIVEAGEARLYEELIPLVQRHAAGRPIYAAPDCPDVYFLSGLQSPTRHYFEFADDPGGHTERILNLLQDLSVNVVAINKAPRFSGTMSPELLGALELRYPRFEDVGSFQVRWKE